MEKKEKKKKAGALNGKAGGAKRNRGNGARGRAGFRGRGSARVKRNVGTTAKKQQTWLRGASNSNVRGAGGSFAKNRYKKNLVRSRSNLSLNQKTTNTRGGGGGGGAAFNARRSRGANRFGLTRSRSRTNLTFNQGGFFTNNKNNNPLLKRTSSLPNLRDPTCVHNRLGYQSPAQIAYRNRVKRAKQLLLQRQNQRLSLQNQLRMAQTGKALLSMQPRILERRQQILTSQRRFTTGGLRSDQIARAQRRAQYEQKIQRMNSLLTPSPNVNFMCTLGSEYAPTARQRPLTLAQNRHTATIGSPRQIPRGRSPYRQTTQGLNMVGRSPLFGRARSRSRSRSRSRTHNTAASDSSGEVDDRTFSEVMYSLSGNLGITGRTLNDRFSF
ncbi:uncharacterized protein LOC116847357 isoform X2 [Odontomachus brunneus]|nr:uncharacterized protein LOC116847357 isoform X2 [Odontomachus brunneus]XP_032678178.1 uncharacterized protein LOC116847357 isoform X2 [Odontomachus brunneus]XP_032678179.1 uncharacterized protein LOC116847357 isoform X2 [Odontomachus brunneus]